VTCLREETGCTDAGSVPLQTIVSESLTNRSIDGWMGSSCVGAFTAPIYRRRATAMPNKNATNKLASGASRVMALMVESGLPGCRAVTMARLSRSTAVCSAAESSVIVRDTSVAVSMARSAVPG
jgi:hypothetical protein